MEEEMDPRQFGITPALFQEWCSPRFGNANPQRIKSNVWEWLVRSRLSAYSARQVFANPSIHVEPPTWSFDRFGQSVTDLTDGRTVYIAGEHEDFYDSDFYIYNDVTVVQPDGTMDFYCYRKSDFPPTDFHTATLAGDAIVIIGSLGYPEERNQNETPVYRLRLATFEIEKMETLGTPPGWIHRHTARLSEGKDSIIVTKGKIDLGKKHALRENIDDWQLHLDDWSWERLTSRNWTQFEIRRTDRRMIPLWDIRHAVWNLEHHLEDFYQQDMDRLEQFIGYRPDVNLVTELYQFDKEPCELHHEEENYNVFWITIDAIRIRFTEEMHGLQVMIEGPLAPDKVGFIQAQLIKKLSALLNSPCELEEY